MRNKFILLLFAMAAMVGCGPKATPDPWCRPLWAMCPDKSYVVCSSAKDLEQVVDRGIIYFSYYNCNMARRTPTIWVGGECELRFR